MIEAHRISCSLALCAVALSALAGAAPAQDGDTPGGGESALLEADEAVEGQPDELHESWQIRRQGNVEGVGSQARIDDISDETDKAFTRYSTALRQIDSIREYNSQMRQLIASQESEIESLSEQVDRVEIVGRSVNPMMSRMIAALEAFVSLDVPFLIDERNQRVGDLRSMMSRADITDPEKFRRVMEAYQIENEYGRTIEAYRGVLQQGDMGNTVDFLRFGRLSLVYQALDESAAGVWNQNTRSWQPLDSSYRSAIRRGLRIARKQAAPDLIRVPISTAVEAGQ